MKLTPKELFVLYNAYEGYYPYQIEEISRRSDKEFDLEIKGKEKWRGTEWNNFSAWLPLAIIRMVDYTRYAEMSSYPEMVKEGDWSGIRDSELDNVWAIFEQVLIDRWNLKIKD